MEGSAVGNGEEPKHRVILFGYVSSMDCKRVRTLTPKPLRTLEEIKGRLQSLSECSQENYQDMEAVCRLAEDVRDAIIEYQVSPDLQITLRMPS